MEVKTSITIPEVYQSIVEDLRLLQRDGNNPNKVTEKQKASTWKSLCDFGWSAPSAIVVNAFDPDGRAYAVDEFYKRETTDEELAEAAKELQDEWGKGTFWCDARFPQSILKLCRAGLDAKPYTFKREDGLRELGSRLTPASDGKPRQFVSNRCVNLISELLEYREDVKENDHAVDALRYSLPLEQE